MLRWSSWLPAVAGALLAGSTGTVARDAHAQPDAADLRMAPGANGTLGAWLVTGSFERTRLPDEEHLSPRLGGGWKIVSSSDGPVDLETNLDAKSDRMAYAGGVLHLDRGGRHYLL